MIDLLLFIVKKQHILLLLEIAEPRNTFVRQLIFVPENSKASWSVDLLREPNSEHEAQHITPTFLIPSHWSSVQLKNPRSDSSRKKAKTPAVQCWQSVSTAETPGTELLGKSLVCSQMRRRSDFREEDDIVVYCFNVPYVSYLKTKLHFTTLKMEVVTYM